MKICPSPESTTAVPCGVLGLLLLAAFLPAPACSAGDKPNIVFILADDLGYGDVRCMNPEGKIPTPHLDRLAAEGIVFTDAHSSSSVCTPTRYGVLTGRYNWRSDLKSGVLYGYSPRLIEAGRLTVASFLRQNGYKTACLGKWHLGMGWPLKNGGFASNETDAWNVDYAQPIADGPISVGFDYFFGISASLDMPPYVFIENDRAQGIPTVEKQWIRKGPATPGFEAIDVLPRITAKAIEYIQQQSADSPFFLYLPLTAPHTPILPSADWEGKSGLNAYGDFIMQIDSTVGQVVKALADARIDQDTLLIFTSDNGCSPQARFQELADNGHHPSHRFRGHKADIFEGGHRIPFIARWPSRIAADTRSDQLICLTDLLATCAEILGTPLPPDSGEDSVSLLPALLGTSQEPLREAVVHHSIEGAFSIRQKQWKLELCPGSGGWSVPRPGQDDTSHLPPIQLYNLETDIGETANVQFEHPEIVVRLTKLLERYVENGRSTPGPIQANTGEVNIWMGGRGR